MNPIQVNIDNQKLYLQRNVLLLIASVFLLSNLLLSFSAFSKKDRTIIIPALERPVELIGSGEIEQFSDSYVEQMTIFFAELLLDLTPNNMQYKSQMLLKHVAPEAYHNFKKHYKEEGEKYEKYRLSTKFDINSMHITDGGLRVEVSGLLSSRFGEDALKQKQVVYELLYKKSPFGLQLISFEELK